MKINKVFYLLLIFLILLFLTQINFFKKVYLLINNNHTERLKNISYDYCSNTATGFIFGLIEKYNFKKAPKIINYDIGPNQNWTLKKNTTGFSNENIILLNYKEKIIFNFDRMKNTNFFISKDLEQNSDGIDFLEIDHGNEKIKIGQTIEFFKIPVGLYDLNKLKIKIDEKKFRKIGKTKITKSAANNRIYFLNNTDINLNDRNSLKIMRFNDTKINFNKIKLHLNNKIDLNKYIILENYNNRCFLLKSND